ncbi:hypothetical protein [Helicobacter cetorum]|uniref:Uncharacterized protein n=1 Tax=Helicobacter cetorum (strain ATCC BAA-540 / CCUG 52418 / MIT 99-5656) TaxID=1163745 RepID=I0EQD0_HELCM|nr:hypothetical protein [Helicobacter cetorum]AFI05149.1 hypothetical protein HCD_00585 [Helicobacter cetorum MIT 99-5656]
MKGLINNIQKIELSHIPLEKYFSKPDIDGELSDLIWGRNAKLKTSLLIEPNERNLKEKIYHFFREKCDKMMSGEIDLNMKITCKEDGKEKETFELFENLVHLNLQVETYYEYIGSLKEHEKRLQYSKQIYKTLIENYYAQN